MQNIGGESGGRKQQREQIQPERGWSVGQSILSQPELQKQRGKSDRCHHHQRQGTVKGCAACVEHDQRQGQQEQSGGNDAPTAGFERRGGIGTRFGQGDRPKLYRDAAALVILGRAKSIHFKRVRGVRCAFQHPQRSISRAVRRPAAATRRGEVGHGARHKGPVRRGWRCPVFRKPGKDIS